ncbi:phosphotransferase [Amycolatopsis sp. NPDC005232]|uniref:phosphotransferase family protein n=1 Tax=Amycolatopsis sp. NPDC005232 TaxID=3157027 RepID=UPI0033A4C865
MRAADQISETDRPWLLQHLHDLRAAMSELEGDRPRTVIHGDAWQGNVAVPLANTATPVLLDLEHVSVGDPAWDLIPLGVDHTDFTRVSATAYRSFVEAYGGYDVTAAPAFRTMADIQELRWVAFVLGKTREAAAIAEARHRIACLRGTIPRPWTWSAW